MKKISKRIWLAKRPVKCQSYKRYTGARKPRCNDGKGCQKCYEVWIASGGDWI